MVLLSFVAGLWLGCAEAAYLTENDDDVSSNDTAGNAADTDVTEDDGAPRLRSLDGGLVLRDGAIIPEESFFTVGSWASGVPECAADLSVVAAVDVAAPDVAEAIRWWSLSLGEPSDPSCDLGLSSQIELGFAPPDVRLQPLMDARGYGSSSAYSVVFGGEPPVVFGIAGTADQLAGRLSVDATVVPDGDYSVIGLYLLP